MIELISPDTKIDFIGARVKFLYLSGALLLACILSVFLIGPTYGIDFKGGTEAVVKLDKKLNSKEVREAFKQIGVNAEQVQQFGPDDANEWMIQTKKVSVVGPKLKADANKGDVSAEAVAEVIKSAAGAEVTDWEWAPENPDRLDLQFAEGASPDTAAIAKAINEQLALKDVEMTDLTGGGTIPKYVVRFQGLQQRIIEGLAEVIPAAFSPDDEASQSTIKRLETVGPRAGKQLRNSGILSILVALFWILIYVAFRFDLRYAPGAVAALAHDVIIAVGFFVFTGLEFTLPIIAALLTIVGYSLNDTIVVFDRIREDLESAGTTPLPEVANHSINEMLSRTINTSLTTLLAVVSIAIIATGLIQNFAIALIVGVVIGTYSSVFIATPVMLKMDEFLEDWREARETTTKDKKSKV